MKYYNAFLKIFKGNVVRSIVYLTFVGICGVIFYDHWFSTNIIEMDRAHVFPALFVLIFCWAYIIDDVTTHYDNKEKEKRNDNR